MAQRQDEFNALGARVVGISSDSVGQNAAVMEKLALTYPLLSDESKDAAVRPLGFDDEGDARQISKPGVVIISPQGQVVYRFVGNDYADRPDESVILAELETLGLPPTSQEAPAVGAPQPGEKAMSIAGLKSYFSGAKFAVMVLRRRHRDTSQEFREDTKRYVAMVERYIEALFKVEERKA